MKHVPIFIFVTMSFMCTREVYLKIKKKKSYRLHMYFATVSVDVLQISSLDSATKQGIMACSLLHMSVFHC